MKHCCHSNLQLSYFLLPSGATMGFPLLLVYIGTPGTILDSNSLNVLPVT